MGLMPTQWYVRLGPGVVPTHWWMRSALVPSTSHWSLEPGPRASGCRALYFWVGASILICEPESWTFWWTGLSPEVSIAWGVLLQQDCWWVGLCLCWALCLALKCPSIRADKLMGGTGSLRNQERGLQMVLANTSVHAVEGALPKGCC